MIAPNGSVRTARWDRIAAALALSFGAAAVARAEPGATTYPRSRALADVAAWIASDTPLSTAQVVDVGPSAVTAVTSSAPTGSPRGFLANISAEALDPALGKQEQILSWTIPVEIDCDKRLVRLGDMTGFSARDLMTAPRVVRSADAAWVAPSPSAPLGAVLRALCDRDFQRPFAAGLKLAKAPDPATPVRTQPPGPPPIVVSERPATKPTPLTTAAAANAAPDAPTPAALAKSKSKAAAAEAPPPAPMIAHGASPYIVQVAASPNQDDAKAALARLERKLPDALKGFKTDVQAAQVDSKTVYRATVSGFAGARDANALCAQIKSAGQVCFVKR